MNKSIEENNDYAIVEVSETIEDILNSMEEEMTAKFYNFNSIKLYAYMNYDAAQSLTEKGIINLPISMYESPRTAYSLAPKDTERRQLMVFAIDVGAGVYDELSPDLRDTIKKSKMSDAKFRGKCEVHRLLKSLDKTAYIEYVVNKKSRIITAMPM